MAIDVIEPTHDENRTDTDDEDPLPERDVSDLTASGVHAYVRSAGQESVHLERRGGRTYLVVDGEYHPTATGESRAR